MKRVWKWLKGLPLNVLLLLIFAAAVFFCVSASRFGATAGSASGTAVGLAVGSYRGVAEGISACAEAGTEAGLSAEDTTSVVKTELEETGRLQVLVAGVKLTDHHSVGNDYAALYILKGSAVFTVDLEQAAVSGDEKSGIDITCPEPEVTVFIDENETEKLAEYQRYRFAGSAEDGYKAYLNTMTASVEEVRQSVENYDALMEQAKAAAKTQIEALARSVRGGAAAVNVKFE